jgi:elongator complex protein 3
VAGFPKSYLPDEPGAKRGWIAHFDPFEQTTMRLRALDSIGHATDKVELLILGGTWSAYPADYQEWFVRRCFDAMNGGEAASLREAHTCNETAAHRNVGLVIETRPDAITLDQVQRLRQLGVTKVQLGAQSLDNAILALNRRGHTVAETRQACRLLRLAGFKLHLHWMPNLLGATPESDRVDFARLWDDPALRPDELKLYPCSLLAGTELYTRWERGEYHPYADEVLVNLLADCKAIIPPYCRVNRVMRDIPAHYIITGSTQSHLRQVVQRALQQRGQVCRCIRCREVRHEKVTAAALRCDVISYQTDATHEYFLSYLTPQDKIAGFVRLALPAAPHADILPELHGCAVIREVHIYGPALEIGESSRGEAQHTGLGTQLIEQAAQLARAQGWKRLAVIAAIGTREYYRRLGFTLGELYMARELSGGKDGSGTGR